MGVLRLAEQVVAAGEGAQAVGAEVLERGEARVLAAAEGEQHDGVAAEAQAERARDRALGGVHQAGLVPPGEGLRRAVGHRAAGAHRGGQRQAGVEQGEHVGRGAVVGVGGQPHPARQRHRRAVVEVLQRVLQPPRAPARLEQREQGVAPGLGEVLALVDDELVELPAGGDLACDQRREVGLHAAEGAGRAEGRPAPGVAQAAVAQLVEGGDLASGRGDAREVVGERSVVAHVERAPAGGERVGVGGERELGLAAARGGGHAQAVRLDRDAARPLGEPAGEPGGELVHLADVRLYVRHQLEQVGEEAVQGLAAAAVEHRVALLRPRQRGDDRG